MTPGNHDVKILFLFFALVACEPDIDPLGRGEGQACGPQPRREIRAEGIPTISALAFDPSHLPPGTRGKFPSFDGDSFAVTIPPRSGKTQTPREIFDEVVAPLMRAMGFQAQVKSMKIPSAGYVFQQLESGVPIENAVVIAAPTSVHGMLFNRYRVTNAVRLSPDAAASAGFRDLAPSARADLVLLPHGGAADGSIALRYAYRMLFGTRDNTACTWLGWIDAESGRILQLTRQFEDE
jgi:hypothetical protein